MEIFTCFKASNLPFFLKKKQAIKTSTFSKEAEKILFQTIFDPTLNGKSYFHLNTFL